MKNSSFWTRQVVKLGPTFSCLTRISWYLCCFSNLLSSEVKNRISASSGSFQNLNLLGLLFRDFLSDSSGVEQIWVDSSPSSNYSSSSYSSSSYSSPSYSSPSYSSPSYTSFARKQSSSGLAGAGAVPGMTVVTKQGSYVDIPLQQGRDYADYWDYPGNSTLSFWYRLYLLNRDKSDGSSLSKLTL